MVNVSGNENIHGERQTYGCEHGDSQPLILNLIQLLNVAEAFGVCVEAIVGNDECLRRFHEVSEGNDAFGDPCVLRERQIIPVCAGRYSGMSARRQVIGRLHTHLDRQCAIQAPVQNVA